MSGVTGIGGLPPMPVAEMELILDDEAGVGSTPLASGQPAAYADISPSAQSIAFTADEQAQMGSLQVTEMQLASTLPGAGAASPSTAQLPAGLYA